MKILVTGAAGFVGSNLTKYLLEEGHNVLGVDNFITGTKRNIENLSGHQNFDFEELDISDQKLALLKERFDEIYHLACPTGVPNLVTLAEEMLLTCSAGTKNVLDIGLRSGAKMIFTSSSEVYGDPQVFPQKEEYTGNVDPTGLRSPYEEGKRFAEGLVSMYSRKYDLDAKIVRVFNTYGFNMSEKDTRVIPAFINQLSQGASLTVHGDGGQKRTFCHVNDLVDGIMLVNRNGEKGQVYNIGGQEEISVLELANLVMKVFGRKSPVEFIDRASHDHQARMPELSKILSLGWSPKISLEEGLKLTLRQPVSPTASLGGPQSAKI